MSKKKRESIISDSITCVTEAFQNTSVFKRCTLQELQARVGSPIAPTESQDMPSQGCRAQSCAGQRGQGAAFCSKELPPHCGSCS